MDAIPCGMPLRRVVIFYSKTKEKHTRGERSFEGVTYSGSLKEIASAEFDAVVSEAGREWVIMSGLERSIFNKISRHKALKDWDIKINYGIKTGYNEAFIIDEETKDMLIKEDKKSAEIIKPVLRGKDINKYSYNFNNFYMIATFPALNLNIDDYSAIKNYLKSFGKRLEQSGEKGCRKKTNNKWFETQDTISYYKDFDLPKIVWGNISSESRFSYSPDTMVVNAPANMLRHNDEITLKYLLAVMNSKVFNYQFTNFGITLGQAYEWKKQYVEPLKIPEADSKTKNNITKLVDDIIMLKKQDIDTTPLEKNIDEIVYSLYGLDDEEVKVVEG